MIENTEKPLDEAVATIELAEDIIKPLANAMRICAKVAKLQLKNNGTAPNFQPIQPVASYKKPRGVDVSYHRYLCGRCQRPFVGPLHAICTCPVAKPKKAEDAA